MNYLKNLRPRTKYQKNFFWYLVRGTKIEALRYMGLKSGKKSKKGQNSLSIPEQTLNRFFHFSCGEVLILRSQDQFAVSSGITN